MTRMASSRKAALVIDDDLLDAVALWEGRGKIRHDAVGDTNLENKAYGAWQIRKPAFQDVQDWYPEYRGESFDRIAKDREFSRLMAQKYLEVLRDKYGINDYIRLISGYNAGPRAREGEIINQDYVDGVVNNLNKIRIKKYVNQYLNRAR